MTRSLANAKTYIKGDFRGRLAQSHCTTAGSTEPRFPTKAAARGRRRPCTAPVTGFSGMEDSVQSRPFDLRRTLREHRLAAGTAQAGYVNLSWDNAALMSLDTLGKLGIAENEAVELEL